MPPQPEWTMRILAADEIERVGEIDLSESGNVVYQWIDGRLTATAERWERPRIDPEGWRRRAKGARQALETGGAALGAFDGDRLIGFAAVRYELAGDVAQLAALWMSRGHRRRGIATALVDEAIRLAKAQGARRMYVSATSVRVSRWVLQEPGLPSDTVRAPRAVHTRTRRHHMLREL